MRFIQLHSKGIRCRTFVLYGAETQMHRPLYGLIFNNSKTQNSSIPTPIHCTYKFPCRNENRPSLVVRVCVHERKPFTLIIYFDRNEQCRPLAHERLLINAFETLGARCNYFTNYNDNTRKNVPVPDQRLHTHVCVCVYL